MEYFEKKRFTFSATWWARDTRALSEKGRKDVRLRVLLLGGHKQPAGASPAPGFSGQQHGDISAVLTVAELQNCGVLVLTAQCWAPGGLQVGLRAQ